MFSPCPRLLLTPHPIHLKKSARTAQPWKETFHTHEKCRNSKYDACTFEESQNLRGSEIFTAVAQ